MYNDFEHLKKVPSLWFITNNLDDFTERGCEDEAFGRRLIIHFFNNTRAPLSRNLNLLDELQKKDSVIYTLLWFIQITRLYLFKKQVFFSAFTENSFISQQKELQKVKKKVEWRDFFRLEVLYIDHKFMVKEITRVFSSFSPKVLKILSSYSYIKVYMIGLKNLFQDTSFLYSMYAVDIHKGLNNWWMMFLYNVSLNRR